jgi:hypothetical protein
MVDLKDGIYRTCPKWGPETAVRVVTIKSDRVYLDGEKFNFHVADFFSVNKLLSDYF